MRLPRFASVLAIFFFLEPVSPSSGVTFPPSVFVSCFLLPPRTDPRKPSQDFVRFVLQVLQLLLFSQSPFPHFLLGLPSPPSTLTPTITFSLVGRPIFPPVLRYHLSSIPTSLSPLLGARSRFSSRLSADVRLSVPFPFFSFQLTQSFFN